MNKKLKMYLDTSVVSYLLQIVLNLKEVNCLNA